MQLTITGHSTALFSTWYFIAELGLLFDAGDGVSAALLQKSRKINHAFISHADRDHVTGLLQLNQLNAREGFPVIYFPEHCGTFPALESFAKQFDPYATGSVWKPVKAGNSIYIKEDIRIECIRNGHVAAPEGISKSLSYKIVQVKQKLKPALAALPPDEIKKVVMEQGKENTTVEVLTPLLGFSGDTPVEDFDRWKDVKILIHEATFLSAEEAIKTKAHGNKHSRLDEVMEMVSTLNIEKLILGHFSSRYDAAQIDGAIKDLCAKFGIGIPVFRILPGQTVADILNQPPVNI
jgi:ribonuclease Z